MNKNYSTRMVASLKRKLKSRGLDTMVSEGIVTIDEQGNYLCVALQEGQPWDVF